jgi:hypothetical protein
MLAKGDLSAQGLVLDYQTINSTITTNFTFQGDTTYYISGSVYLYGTNTFEAGTVIKYGYGDSISLFANTNYFQGSSYHPIVFTALDDNSVGEPIGTGYPSGYYAYSALFFYNSAPFDLSNFRISNESCGIVWYAGSVPATLANGQFYTCWDGLIQVGGTANVENVLFNDVAYDLMGIFANFNALNCTFANNGYVMATVVDWANAAFTITNSVFCNVPGNLPPSGSTVVADHNAFYGAGAWTGYPTIGTSAISLSSYPYQTAVGGNYYLTSGSGCQSNGTVNIDPALLAGLADKTTCPPIVYANAAITTNLVLGPQARRDNIGNPDLGYHYDPLDYAFGGCTAYSNVTFTDGTAVGWYFTGSGFSYGIELTNNVMASFQGIATAPDYWVRLNTVQEADFSASTGFGGGIIGMGTSSATATTVQVDFLISSMLANGEGPHFAFNNGTYNYGYLNINAVNSEFWGGSLRGWYTSYSFTNCLLYRIDEIGSQAANSSLVMQNSTLKGGSLLPLYAVVVLSSAFDGTSCDVESNSSYCDFNAFLAGDSRLIVHGPHDVIVTNSYNWQSSWFGNFYLPPGSPLIDAGNTTADQICLYHFTTQTNQVPEGNSIVDIGYHYVATDQDGNPLDTNGDGIADYLEDANGNGIFDAGDLGEWKISPYGLGEGNGLQVFTPLK